MRKFRKLAVCGVARPFRILRHGPRNSRCPISGLTRNGAIYGFRDRIIEIAEFPNARIQDMQNYESPESQDPGAPEFWNSGI